MRYSAKGLISLGQIPDISSQLPKETVRFPAWLYQEIREARLERSEKASAERSEEANAEKEELCKKIAEDWVSGLISGTQDSGFSWDPDLPEILGSEGEAFWTKSNLYWVSLVTNPRKDLSPVEMFLAWGRRHKLKSSRCAQTPSPAFRSLHLILLAQKLIIPIKTDWDPRRLCEMDAEFDARETFCDREDLTRLPSWVGAHTKKFPTLEESIRKHLEYRGNLPMQVFLHSTYGAGGLTSDDVTRSKRFIQERPVPVFSHSPYVINLSNPGTKTKSRDETLQILKDELIWLREVNGKGVVVHVGKSVKMSTDQAMEEMRRSINEVILAASKTCPLLLETPAGSGTELIVGRRAFSDFVDYYRGDDRLCTCLDTCHIFSAGEDPVDYVQRFTDQFPGKVRLIHFNDSETPMGSCVDRHAPIGRGHLGGGSLHEVAGIAKSKKIPCVIEY